MSSNPKDNYWDVGPLGEVRSFGLALADSGESVRGGGGDKKAKVLERVRRDASPRFKGDMGRTTSLVYMAFCIFILHMAEPYRPTWLI